MNSVMCWDRARTLSSSTLSVSLARTNGSCGGTNGGHFKNGQDGDMAIYGATDAHLPSIVLAADLPTSSANLSVGQLWNDNGTLKIKQ